MHERERLREDAEAIVREAIEAVLPEAAVREALRRGEIAERLGRGRVVLAAIGKAAWRMARAAVDQLGPGLGGALVTKHGHSMGDIEGVEVFEAGHPLPDEGSVRGAEAILRHVQGLGPDDTVLFLVSGGGSALFELPAPGVSLADMADVTSQLLACGAGIVEINTIRKRLSSVKGGRFAQLCAPAHVSMIVLSDVLGDPLDAIASGPAWPDASTSEEALSIVERYGLSLSPAMMEALRHETPKELDDVEAVVTGSVSELCRAAMRAAEARGYASLLLTSSLDCEAREAGAFLASVAREARASGAPLSPPCAIVAGGEPVVHVRGKGMGGRAQELALAAARGIAGLEGVVVASVGSDGTDGPTDAAGGIVDGSTSDRLRSAGLDLGAMLDDDDAYRALSAVGSLIVTGPTGTNVNDLSLVLLR